MARQSTVGAAAVGTFAETFEAVVENVAQILQGKEDPTRLALVCLAAEGHLLLEDVPGVGKTSLAKALARSFDLEWRRIQFTPDLLPSDVTGASVYDRENGSFVFRPGGVFANVVLGDEINRASPKTQSALLEAMQERQVTVDNVTRRLPSPFLVIATQNPVEHEGTYPLPESQLDRFLLRVRMGYPDRTAEMAMLEQPESRTSVDDLPPVAGPDAIPTMVSLANQVHVATALKAYIVDLATATRNHPALSLGMSPRADIKYLAGPVLEHRLVLSPEGVVAGVDISDVVTEVLRGVPVPPGHTGM
jgi:MoxR-like ATPase